MSDPNNQNITDGWEMDAESSALLNAFESDGLDGLNAVSENEAKESEELVSEVVDDLVNSTDLAETEEPVEEDETDLDEDTEESETEDEEEGEITDEELSLIHI